MNGYLNISTFFLFLVSHFAMLFSKNKQVVLLRTFSLFECKRTLFPRDHHLAVFFFEIHSQVK